MESISDEYNQCVFIRYYTVRRRLGIPRIIKAAAGPHELGGGGRHDDESPLQARYDLEQDSDSDSDSDTASSLFDSDGDDDGCSIISTDTESDIVMHNMTTDGRDDFDIIADHIFRNSDAESVLLHHRDIARLRESGGSTDLSTLVFEARPPITVDGNGGPLFFFMARSFRNSQYSILHFLFHLQVLRTRICPSCYLPIPCPEIIVDHSHGSYNDTKNMPRAKQNKFQLQNSNNRHDFAFLTGFSLFDVTELALRYIKILVCTHTYNH